MKPSLIERQRKTKTVLAVLIVGLTVSALVGIMLFYMGRAHVRF